MVIVFGMFQGRPFVIENEEGHPVHYESIAAAKDHLKGHKVILYAGRVVYYDLENHEREIDQFTIRT